VPTGAEVANRQEERTLVGYRTAHSAMTLGVGANHVVETNSPYRTAVTLNGDCGELVLTVDAVAGGSVNITKYVTHHSSRGVPSEELVRDAGSLRRRLHAPACRRYQLRHVAACLLARQDRPSCTQKRRLAAALPAGRAPLCVRRSILTVAAPIALIALVAVHGRGDASAAG
jgi:hypothetical protein